MLHPAPRPDKAAPLQAAKRALYISDTAVTLSETNWRSITAPNQIRCTIDHPCGQAARAGPRETNLCWPPVAAPWGLAPPPWAAQQQPRASLVGLAPSRAAARFRREFATPPPALHEQREDRSWWRWLHPTSKLLSWQQVSLEPLDGPNEGIFWLTLCRPDARNAIGRQFLRELRECLATVAQVRPPRAPRPLECGRAQLRPVYKGIFSANRQCTACLPASHPICSVLLPSEVFRRQASSRIGRA